MAVEDWVIAPQEAETFGQSGNSRITVIFVNKLTGRLERQFLIFTGDTDAFKAACLAQITSYEANNDSVEELKALMSSPIDVKDAIASQTKIQAANLTAQQALQAKVEKL